MHTAISHSACVCVSTTSAATQTEVSVIVRLAVAIRDDTPWDKQMHRDTDFPSHITHTHTHRWYCNCCSLNNSLPLGILRNFSVERAVGSSAQSNIKRIHFQHFKRVILCNKCCIVQFKNVQGHKTFIYLAHVLVFIFYCNKVHLSNKKMDAFELHIFIFMHLQHAHTDTHTPSLRASPFLSPTPPRRRIHPPAHPCSRADPHVHAICSESAKTTAV